MTPVLLLGAGRMGGALLDGWRRTGAVAAADLVIADPSPGPEALAAAREGARLRPADPEISSAQTVVLAVKPQLWRAIATAYAQRLAPDAVLLSIVAGAPASAVSAGFGGRRTARVMPTTAVAVAKGAAAIFSDDPEACRRAHALFDPVATTADLSSEALMNGATAVAGSAPAYLYAFLEALEAAGVSQGLPPDGARTLARATIVGAAALLAETGAEPSQLRAQVTSPGGTTEAALKVLLSERGLEPLLREAVAAAVRRAEELGG
ncbi:MAG TPA: pyrroline-5-carboxylate reductase [Caulobacteraceae bacterium]|jgi:pyrroline-5-carboxylate reductase